MPAAYEGTDIISCLRSKYIIRRSNISFFMQEFEFIRETAKNIFFIANSLIKRSQAHKGLASFCFAQSSFVKCLRVRLNGIG